MTFGLRSAPFIRGIYAPRRATTVTTLTPKAAALTGRVEPRQGPTRSSIAVYRLTSTLNYKDAPPKGATSSWRRLWSRNSATASYSRLELKVSFPGVGLVAALGFAATAVGILLLASQRESEPSLGDSSTPDEAMTGDVPPGRPGNLTPDQEEILKQMWLQLLKLCQVGQVDGGGHAEPVGPAVDGAGATAMGSEETKSTAQTHKKKRSFFSRKRAESEAETPGPTAVTATATATSIALDAASQDDKYGQTKQFYDTLANQTPECIRSTIWSMVKHDNPDALLLRFLRARKWDVDKALVMMISTMSWRATEMHVDDDIMKNGEGAAALAEKADGVDDDAKQMGRDFLAQMRMGKSFLHGCDKAGRPICFVRVRMHRQGEHLERALERNTVYLIETARLLLKPPVDTATIIFDMTGFSMANMDYAPVKFMIKCFEANYPESLGAILVYKSPWIFQGIWKVIRGWLDPVVSSKVHFLQTPKEMAEYVHLDKLPKEVDGNSEWEYRYVEPAEGENSQMADTATRDRLLDAREQQVKDYEAVTLEWLKTSDAEKTAAIKERRNAVATKLRNGYWELDPYLRARSLFDRIAMIGPGGDLDFYPDENAATAKANGTAAAPAAPVALAAPVSVDDDVD